uniref:Uncharacterized protein n=1 Tax=Branchiostoma floridae TaxID=7739 RepID=C3Z505_BRAFL|eukprot:XP_002596350.1 hypothetical protein BRAFLDRAFT_76150 [Branchiostoma floridae]
MYKLTRRSRLVKKYKSVTLVPSSGQGSTPGKIRIPADKTCRKSRETLRGDQECGGTAARVPKLLSVGAVIFFLDVRAFFFDTPTGPTDGKRKLSFKAFEARSSKKPGKIRIPADKTCRKSRETLRGDKECGGTAARVPKLLSVGAGTSEGKRKLSFKAFEARSSKKIGDYPDERAQSGAVSNIRARQGRISLHQAFLRLELCPTLGPGKAGLASTRPSYGWSCVQH